MEKRTTNLGIEAFRDENIGFIRTAIDIDGRIVFCLKDACEILGIKNSRDAKTRLRKDGLANISINSKVKPYTFITEPNLYRLIFQSKKPEAVKFCDWIVEEVLPALRTTGHYSVENILQSKDSGAAFIADYNALVIRNRALEEVQEETKEAREYMKRTLRTYRLIDLADLPSVLKMRSVGFSDVTSVLRNQGILDDDDIPTQEYIEKKWFRVDTHTFTQDKSLITIKRVLVYKTGENGIRKLILESRGIK